MQYWRAGVILQETSIFISEIFMDISKTVIEYIFEEWAFKEMKLLVENYLVATKLKEKLIKWEEILVKSYSTEKSRKKSKIKSLTPVIYSRLIIISKLVILIYKTWWKQLSKNTPKYLFTKSLDI